MSLCLFLKPILTICVSLDPSIRISFPAIQKNLSKSGFYSKSKHIVYTQRLTIHNTKSAQLNNLKLIDQVPVPESSEVQVKLVSPALATPSPLKLDMSRVSSPPPKATLTVTSQVSAGEGIVAQWDGAGEPEVNVDALGRDGRFNWICSIPPRSKINLTLQWEVTMPEKTEVIGL